MKERVCSWCNEVEDEKHFLLDCELYEDIRNDTLEKCSQFPKGDANEGLSWLMGSTNWDLTSESTIPRFVYQAKKRRDRFLEML